MPIFSSAEISIHAPRTGSDTKFQNMPKIATDFNPRSPHGERRRIRQLCSKCCYFNPRSPHGERRAPCPFALHFWKFQSTLPARGATTKSLLSINPNQISIHAPRTGSDVISYTPSVPAIISIHAPRTGSDVVILELSSSTTPFQSTLPARGATFASPSSLSINFYFNPRSPHGERRSRAP